ASIGPEKFDIQIPSNREVEHGVNRMLVLFLSNLAQRFTNILFQFRFAAVALDNEDLDWSAYASLNYLQPPVSIIKLALHRFTKRRVAHLGNLFGLCAGGDLTPGRAGIVQVPMFHGKSETGANRSGLTVDRKTFGADAF